MATVMSRQLKIGTIIDKTLAVLELSTGPVLIFILAFTAVNVAIGYFELSLTAVTEQIGVGIAKFVVAVAASYLLLDAMVRKTGLLERADQDVFFPFIGLSLLYILGVYAGFFALIVPGLVIMARWSIAQPLFIARGGKVMAALGESWERTKGAEGQIICAALALLLLPIAVIIACYAMFEKDDMIGIVVSQLATSATSVVSAAFGVALYGLIEARRAAANQPG